MFDIFRREDVMVFWFYRHLKYMFEVICRYSVWLLIIKQAYAFKNTLYICCIISNDKGGLELYQNELYSRVQVCLRVFQ